MGKILSGQNKRVNLNQLKKTTVPATVNWGMDYYMILTSILDWYPKNAESSRCHQRICCLCNSGSVNVHSTLRDRAFFGRTSGCWNDWRKNQLDILHPTLERDVTEREGLPFPTFAQKTCNVLNGSDTIIGTLPIKQINPSPQTDRKFVNSYCSPIFQQPQTTASRHLMLNSVNPTLLQCILHPPTWFCGLHFSAAI
jgi:hypothetical protein